MLVRDAPEPDADGSALEVLMVRRNLQSDFVGGAFVFPGGSVDPPTGGRGRGRLRGRSDAEASALLGVDSGGWPTGWPRCARPSRRPACCWPSGRGARPSWPASPRRRPASWPSGPR
jgi:hypothetical protein